MRNNKDKIKGRLEEAKGKVKAVIGNILSNKELEVKGNIQKNVGTVQASVADTKEDAFRLSVRILALLIASGSSLMISMPAAAELSPALDRISISAGVFRVDPKFNAALNTKYGNLQSGDIGLGVETMTRVKGDMMIFDSQGLSFDYYQYKRGYTGSITNNTNVFGTTLTTVGNANLNINLDFAKLEYRWWFGSGNTVLGLGAGAAYYRVSLNANATASININNMTASISDGYSSDAVAPLLGIGVRHAISQDMRLFADASGVKQSRGRLDGGIYNAAVGAEWFPVKNVGIVLDYSMSQFDLTRHDTVNVNFKLKIQGPSASVKVRF
jgi:uncharacterized protein YjbJ (UPF0337 family)